MMTRRTCTVAMAVLAVLMGMLVVCSRGRAADAAPPAPTDDGKAELAERFYGLAKEYLLHTATITPADYKAAAAIFREAERLNPAEPRYPRAAYESLQDAGDLVGAIDEVQKYEAVYGKAHGGDHDRVAEQAQVDLNLLRMQSVDSKISYMDQLLKTDALSTDIRAHAAVVEAQLFEERSQSDKALEEIEAAIKLDPLNVEARQAKLELAGGTETAAQQLGDLLALVRCNPVAIVRCDPAKPLAIARVGQILAHTGLVDAAIKYLNMGAQLYSASGMPISEDFAQDLGAELFIGGRAQQAIAYLTQYNAANPSDGGGWTVRLAAEKSNDKNGSYAAVQKLAESSMLNSMGQVSAAMRKEMMAGSTTAPATSMPTGEFSISDVAADVAMLKANGSRWQASYLAMAGRLAWYLAYFKKDVSGTQQMIDALQPLVPQTDSAVQRLEGWMAYDSGDLAAARAKWAPVAEKDPLANLGLILLNLADPKTKVAATAQARRLLSLNPSGILGAVLWNALASVTGPVAPGPQADVIQAQLGQFPQDFLDIVSTPAMFYDITLTPHGSAIEFGQPLLVDLVIRNVSNYDLTIGPDGTVHNDLWFDGQILGVQTRAVLNITFDRLTGRHVLKKGESLRQTIRVDEGPLLAIFRATPSTLMQFQVYVTTNPVRSTSGAMIKGPCGMKANTPNEITRLGTSVLKDTARQAELVKLSTSPATEQLRIMDFLVVSTRSMMPEPKPAGLYLPVPSTAPVDDALWTADARAAIEPLAGSQQAAARAWAMRALAELPGADRAKMIADMLADPDADVRMVGLVIAQDGPDHGLAADQAAQDDSDQLVKALAGARLEKLAAPTTQATTIPTTQAAVSPAK